MKNLLVLFCFIFSTFLTQAQSLNDLLKKGQQIINGGSTSNNGGNGLGGKLSNGEIVNGLKEALRVGTQNAAGKLNKTNGFFGNQLIKKKPSPSQ
jgi:hypothetical protein